MSEKIRIDKWLWSVRLYKTRTQASDACTGGKVQANDAPVKASYLTKVGDIIRFKKDHINYTYEVVKLIDKRVGAPIAQECYLNHTPEAELNKLKHWFDSNPATEFRDRGTGRPTKKERREIDKFKDIGPGED